MIEKEQFKSIDVSHLNSGLLFVQLETAKGSITKKVVKK
ncbi:MAG: T9SS type A sorting domain-containing protein [Flavobacteriaceae bacterium]|nr:T9SS type A sorting domain-containing protein [Flavobacteriaceae bacterium]